MKSRLYLIALILLGCSKETKTDPFQVGLYNVGKLTDSTKVYELESVFDNDSLHTYIGGDEFTGNINNIEVYDSLGVKLLELTPFETLDSTSTIKSIRIINSRYKTSKGLGRSNTFKDIRDNYQISGIQNTLNNLIISVDEINAYFTIDKRELPPEMRFDMSMKIEAIQIPDRARIKDFYIQWY